MCSRCNPQVDGIPIATFDTPSSPTTVNAGTLSTEVKNSLLKINPGQEGPFAAFMANLITKEDVPFTLRGNVDATFTTKAPFVGPFRVTNIGFDSPISLRGCASFPKIDYLEQVSLTFDPATGFYTLESLVNINNPSQLVLNLGDISFQTIDKAGLSVGTTIFKNMNLEMGDKQFTAVTTITVKTAYDALIANGDTFTFQGSKDSSANPILAESLKSLTTQVVIPKLKPVAA